MTVSYPEADVLPDLSQLTDELGDVWEDTDDPLHRTHVVSPPENVRLYSLLVGGGNADPSAQDIVDYARETRREVVALCGYKWVPKANPDKYDACQACFNLASMYMSKAGE